MEKIPGNQPTNWQRLDAMKRFVQPKVEYVMRTMLSNHTWIKGLDDVVRGMVKKAFSLPRRTVISFSMCLGSMKDWGSMEARRAVKDASFDGVLKFPPGKGRESQK